MDQIHFPNREAFRTWLKENYLQSTGFWMLFYKKHTKKSTIEYGEAVEEAICFGWIDSIVKRLDEDRYLRKFTPRKDFTNWSKVNQKRAEKMFLANRIQSAGMRTLQSCIINNKLVWPQEEDSKDKEIRCAEHLATVLKNNEPAWMHFQNMAPSYQKNYVQWIADAKREATQKKRINEAVALLKQNKKPGMK